MDALKRGMRGKNGKAVICVSTREATFKKRLRRHLKILGFHKTDEGVFARPAGVAAAKDFVKHAGIDEDGFVRDTCGRASLKVGDRSGHFRSALKRLDPDAEAWEGYGGF